MKISELKVMRSAAGYYIGRSCVEDDGQPYSRESGYYPTKELAEAELNGSTFEVRVCVENEHAYNTGVIPRHRG